MRQVRIATLGQLALALLVLIAYLPALQAGYLWDDQDYVVENANLVHPDGWHRIWFEPRTMVQYYPLVHTVLRVEHSLWQKDPRGYHLVNILLQAACAILLWRILQRLAVPGAWVIAALFGIHPIQVESVAWITEIKNLLSGLFYFLAILAYLRFFAARADEQAPRGRKRDAPRPWRFYGLAMALYLLALLSKATVVTLPVVLLVIVWWKSGALRRRDILPLVPMFLLALGFGAFTWWLETHHVGSAHAIALTMSERLLAPARSAWFYIGKLLWPVDLAFIYPRWTVDPGQWWQYLFPLGAIAAVAALWLLRGRLGRGPLAAVLFYLVSLALVSGAVRYYFLAFSFVGDHFAYLACIGILALAVAPVARWAAGTRSTWWRVVVCRVAPALLLAIVAVLTWNRTQVYRTEEALWRDTVAKNPTAWLAHNNLGVIYMRQGRNVEASARFVQALNYNPDIAEAHSNLGAIYQEQGNAEQAIAEYRKAIALKPFMYNTQYELGALLLARGDTKEAGQRFSEAIRHNPRMAEAHAMLGSALAVQGRFDRAVEEFRAALAIDPMLADVYPQLGWVLVKQRAFAEARDVLSRAVQLIPGDASTHELLGIALENLGDTAGALWQYQRALELNPETPRAREGLKRLSGRD